MATEANGPVPERIHDSNAMVMGIVSSVGGVQVPIDDDVADDCGGDSVSATRRGDAASAAATVDEGRLAKMEEFERRVASDAAASGIDGDRWALTAEAYGAMPAVLAQATDSLMVPSSYFHLAGGVFIEGTKPPGELKKPLVNVGLGFYLPMSDAELAAFAPLKSNQVAVMANTAHSRQEEALRTLDYVTQGLNHLRATKSPTSHKTKSS
ncbi:hypothetical protein Pelo_16566 [Pelomyxa schiedti]|nr:hypothetical protein Pelo_16566 [Pelomyxa schiedti]